MTPDRIIAKLQHMPYGSRWGGCRCGWTVERMRSAWMVTTVDEILLTADPVKVAALIRAADGARKVDTVDEVDMVDRARTADGRRERKGGDR